MKILEQEYGVSSLIKMQHSYVFLHLSARLR